MQRLERYKRKRIKTKTKPMSSFPSQARNLKLVCDWQLSKHSHSGWVILLPHKIWALVSSDLCIPNNTSGCHRIHHTATSLTIFLWSKMQATGNTHWHFMLRHSLVLRLSEDFLSHIIHKNQMVGYWLLNEIQVVLKQVMSISSCGIIRQCNWWLNRSDQSRQLTMPQDNPVLTELRPLISELLGSPSPLYYYSHKHISAAQQKKSKITAFYWKLRGELMS